MAKRLSRSNLIAEAADLSDQIGLDQVTITKVGRHVGISPPGVYRHVTDLDDLQAAIGSLAADELNRELAASLVGLSGPEALNQVAITIRNWARSYPGRYAALQVAPDPDEAAAQQNADQLVATIAASIRSYGLTGDDLTDAIRLIRSLLHGFITLEQGGGFKQPRDIELSFTRVTDSLDLILRDWPPPNPSN